MITEETNMCKKCTSSNVEKVVSFFNPAWFDDSDGAAIELAGLIIASLSSDLLAQGMEKAAEVIEKAGGRPGYVAPDYQPGTIKLAAELIRASAAKLREGKGP